MKISEQKTCVVYVRVSTIDKQDNARQLSDLREFAKAKKFLNIGEFHDKITGSSNTEDRIGFKSMQAFIKKENIKNVLVWELSRVGRSMRNVVNTIEDFADDKVNIHFYKNNISVFDENGKRNIITKIMLSVISGFAEIEKDMIQARVISGLKNSAKNGGAGGGAVKAYGYCNIDKKLVVDEEESKIVNEIFSMYLRGNGTMKIASYLNSKGVRTKYNKTFKKKIKTKSGRLKTPESYRWRDGTIYSILTNRIYIGKRKFGDDVYDCPAIIDEKNFEAVQVLLKSKNNKNGINSKYLNLLGGKLTCGNCDSSYFMHKRANKKDNAYKCLSKRQLPFCGNASIGIDKLNNALFQYIQKSSFADIVQQRDSISNKRSSIEFNIRILSQQVDETREEINKVSQGIKRLLDIYSETDQAQDQLNELLSEKMEVEERLKNRLVKQMADLVIMEGQYESYKRDYINVSNPLTFKDLVQFHIEKIKIHSISNYFAEIYTNAQDQLVLIHVSTVFDGSFYLIVSQRSTKMIVLDNSCGDWSYENIELNINWIKYEVEEIDFIVKCD